MSAGLLEDHRRREANKRAGHTLCDHCNGTGNELYAMYRFCPACGGDGIAVRFGRYPALIRKLALRRERNLHRRALRRACRVGLDWRHPRAAFGMALGFGPHADGQAHWEIVSRIRWAASHYLCIGQWFWNGKDDCWRCGTSPGDIDFQMRRVGFRQAECIDDAECGTYAAENDPAAQPAGGEGQ